MSSDTEDNLDSFDHLIKTNVGTRAFSVAAPSLWNSLPVSVKSVGNIAIFRLELKPQIFKRASPPQLPVY